MHRRAYKYFHCSNIALASSINTGYDIVMRESKSRIKISCRIAVALVIFSIEFCLVSNCLDSISL